jgi:hypothetical protein
MADRALVSFDFMASNIAATASSGETKVCCRDFGKDAASTPSDSNNRDDRKAMIMAAPRLRG